MTRYKKIRGYNRRHRQIESWRTSCLNTEVAALLRPTDYRHYAKINIAPWNSLNLSHSKIKPPRGKTRLLMLNALFDIFEHWRHQLNLLGLPYYLKIWLYHPNFAQSQVVCAGGHSIHFYQNVFFAPANAPQQNLSAYGALQGKLQTLQWQYCLDEEHLYTHKPAPNKAPDFELTQKQFRRLLKKPHRTYSAVGIGGNQVQYISVSRGTVWVGG